MQDAGRAQCRLQIFLGRGHRAFLVDDILAGLPAARRDPRGHSLRLVGWQCMPRAGDVLGLRVARLPLLVILPVAPPHIQARAGFSPQNSKSDPEAVSSLTGWKATGTPPAHLEFWKIHVCPVVAPWVVPRFVPRLPRGLLSGGPVAAPRLPPIVPRWPGKRPGRAAGLV